MCASICLGIRKSAGHNFESEKNYSRETERGLLKPPPVRQQRVNIAAQTKCNNQPTSQSCHINTNKSTEPAHDDDDTDDDRDSERHNDYHRCVYTQRSVSVSSHIGSINARNGLDDSNELKAT